MKGGTCRPHPSRNEAQETTIVRPPAARGDRAWGRKSSPRDAGVALRQTRPRPATMSSTSATSANSLAQRRQMNGVHLRRDDHRAVEAGLIEGGASVGRDDHAVADVRADAHRRGNAPVGRQAQRDDRRRSRLRNRKSRSVPMNAALTLFVTRPGWGKNRRAGRCREGPARRASPARPNHGARERRSRPLHARL